MKPPRPRTSSRSGSAGWAGSARRLAALRGTAAISVVTSDEVASHELLMASVPASVLRSFRERNACAAKMYVHVNTVRYRIRRIEELTGRDLSCLDDQVDFFLALRIR